MNKRIVIIASVVGVVFCFAGYNLWSYFKEQAAIQAEEDRIAEERRIKREEERQARVAAQEAEERRRLAEAETRRLEEERLAAERRAAREAEEAAKEEARAQERAESAARRLAQATARARDVGQIEEVPFDVVDQLRALSPRYMVDNPDEFLTQKFDPTTFGYRTNVERLMQAGTDALMLYAAVSQNTAQLQALIDIGMDVNAQNERGYTPLMFAAAYNGPEAITFLLNAGADVSAKAYVEDLTPLHIAALFNPNPNTIDALVDGKAELDTLTITPFTPLLLACRDNKNLEVAGRLAARGADKTPYSPEGFTAKALCEARLRGDGKPYRKITDEVNEEVMSRF